jgi:hypothetical protein
MFIVFDLLTTKIQIYSNIPINSFFISQGKLKVCPATSGDAFGGMHPVTKLTLSLVLNPVEDETFFLN